MKRLSSKYFIDTFLYLDTWELVDPKPSDHTLPQLWAYKYMTDRKSAPSALTHALQALSLIFFSLAWGEHTSNVIQTLSCVTNRELCQATYGIEWYWQALGAIYCSCHTFRDVLAKLSFDRHQILQYVLLHIINQVYCVTYHSLSS